MTDYEHPEFVRDLGNRTVSYFRKPNGELEKYVAWDVPNPNCPSEGWMIRADVSRVLWRLPWYIVAARVVNWLWRWATGRPKMIWRW